MSAEQHSIGIRPGEPNRAGHVVTPTWQGFCSCGWSGVAHPGGKGKKREEARAGAMADAQRHAREQR